MELAGLPVSIICGWEAVALAMDSGREAELLSCACRDVFCRERDMLCCGILAE